MPLHVAMQSQLLPGHISICHLLVTANFSRGLNGHHPAKCLYLKGMLLSSTTPTA